MENRYLPQGVNTQGQWERESESEAIKKVKAAVAAAYWLL